MNSTGMAAARKSIHDATDKTPDTLKSVGISAGDWFRQLRKHLELLLSDVTEEECRFALVLMQDALDS